MKNLNFRKLSLVIGIAFVCAGILACQIPGIARNKPTVEDIAHDPSLVAVWREARRIGEGEQLSEPSAPLLIGFLDDGTFKAVFESHRFETHHDFWGEWKTEGDSLTLTITGGNNLPRSPRINGGTKCKRMNSSCTVLYWWMTLRGLRRSFPTSALHQTVR
jgi:hypothetical protein